MKYGTRTRNRLLIAALLTLGLGWSGSTGVQAGEEGWRSDYKAALAEAEETGLPILLVFR